MSAGQQYCKENEMLLLSRLGLVCVLAAVSVPAQTGGVARPAVPGDSPLQNHPDTTQAFPNFAQRLTEQELKLHPDVLVVAFHAQIPGEPINRVVAINQAQWGKFLWRPSDDIDTDTAKTQRTVVQVIPATHRMEVHMPLHTKTGETIATFVCVWNFKDEEEAPELMRKAQAIRDEIAPQISDIGQLLGK
jgi:hypothetical protein